MLINGEAPGVLARWTARAPPGAHRAAVDGLRVWGGGGDHAWREDDPTGPIVCVRPKQSFLPANTRRSRKRRRSVSRGADSRRSMPHSAAQLPLRTMIRLCWRARARCARWSRIRWGVDVRSHDSSRAWPICMPGGTKFTLGERRFARANGLVHLTNSGAMTVAPLLPQRWRGGAAGSRNAAAQGARGCLPSPAKDYPVKAVRPGEFQLIWHARARHSGINRCRLGKARLPSRRAPVQFLSLPSARSDWRWM